MMLPEIESVRGQRFHGTPEAQRFAWEDVQLPGNCIQLLTSEAAQVAALGKMLVRFLDRAAPLFTHTKTG